MKLFELSIAGYGLQINGGLTKSKRYKFSSYSGYEKGLGFYSTPHVYFVVWKIRLAFRFLVGVE